MNWVKIGATETISMAVSANNNSVLATATFVFSRRR